MEILNVTLNPNDMSSGNTLSNGNLTVTSSTSRSRIRATHGKTTGKWYWEVKFDSGSQSNFIGISNEIWDITNTQIVIELNPNWRAYYGGGGSRYPDNTAYSSIWAIGNIIGIALDLDNGTLEFYKNGISMGISHTNVKELGEVYPVCMSYSTSAKTLTFNFGATPFAHSAPSGFYPYNIEFSDKILISSEDEYYSIVPEVYATETAIPQMTSNTTPSGRVFASSESSVGVSAKQAFDRTENAYATASGTVIGQLGYEFNSPIIIRKYIVRSYGSTLNAMPKDWTFEGSNDGNSWDAIDTQANQSWTTINTDKEYNIAVNKINSYTMYRLNWTANNGHTQTYINELKMFEYIAPKLLELPNKSEQTFINHGMNIDTSIDLTTSKILERRYIVQDNSLLSSGKVFKQKIDTTKIPIKNAMIE